MNTRIETLTQIENNLLEALQQIRAAKAIAPKLDNPCDDVAAEEYGRTIMEALSTLGRNKELVNNYLDEDEFYNCDRL